MIGHSNTDSERIFYREWTRMDAKVGPPQWERGRVEVVEWEEWDWLKSDLDSELSRALASDVGGVADPAGIGVAHPPGLREASYNDVHPQIPANAGRLRLCSHASRIDSTLR